MRVKATVVHVSMVDHLDADPWWETDVESEELAVTLWGVEGDPSTGDVYEAILDEYYSAPLGETENFILLEWEIVDEE